MINKSLLRLIPSVNKIVYDLQVEEHFTHSFLTSYVRDYLKNLRDKISLDEKSFSEQDLEYQKILQGIKNDLISKKNTNIRKAINATGVILHTGLGRAVLPAAAIENLVQNLMGYCILEIDCNTGERTIRDVAVKDLLCILTNAEDATVVNNNAGAILLTLASLAKGKEVIVSRGQLVEIGGSFRVPEIMSQSGAKLVEVGCTNSTHLSDYENAISENTAAILFVHTSNFKIAGFSNEVPLENLADLAHKNNLLLIEDSGSGAILDFSSWGLRGDPIVPQSLNKGADVVTFSADKLLGSCQAGIILGKQSLLKKIRKHPLARVLRVDKLTLSVLEATLQLYTQNRHQEIPTFAMLTEDIKNIRNNAEKLAKEIAENCECIEIKVEQSQAMAGSGSFPTLNIPSYAVMIKTKISSFELAKKMRNLPIPIFTRLDNDYIIMDVRTLLTNQIEVIAKSLQEILHSKIC